MTTTDDIIKRLGIEPKSAWISGNYLTTLYTHSDLERIVAEANKRADAIAAEREAYAHELAECRDVFAYGTDMDGAVGDPLEVAYFVRGRVAKMQAENKLLRDALEEVVESGLLNGSYRLHDKVSEIAYKSISTPSDHSALDAAIKQAKIEVLEEAANILEVRGQWEFSDKFRRMANELKGE